MGDTDLTYKRRCPREGKEQREGEGCWEQILQFSQCSPEALTQGKQFSVLAPKDSVGGEVKGA